MKRRSALVLGILALWAGCEKAPSPGSSTPPPPGPVQAAKPGEVEALVRKALEEHRAGRDPAAVEAADAAIRADPSCARAYAVRAIGRALVAYYGFFQIRPDIPSLSRDAGTPWTFYHHAEEETRKRDASKKSGAMAELNLALGDAERAIDLNKVDEFARVARGVVYLFRGDLDETANYEKAVEDFSQALILKSDCPDARYYRAWAYYKLGYEPYARKCGPEGIQGFTNGIPQESNFPSDRTDLEELLRKSADDWGRVKDASSAPWMVFRGSVPVTGASHPHGPLPSLPGFLTKWGFLKKDQLSRNAPPLEPAAVFEQAKESVVLIETKTSKGDFMGSGFVIGEGQEVVTNAHVVAGALNGRVTIRFIDESQSVGVVLRSDAAKDLALVQIQGRKGKPLHVENPRSKFTPQIRAFLNAEVGTRLVVIGHPKGLEWSMTSGIASAFRTLKGVELMQIDAPITHGNSGGPVLDLYGTVVGVATRGFTDVAGLNFAVSGKELNDFVYAR